MNHTGSGGGGGGGSYHPDPNYPNFNPYAQEFMISEQDRQYDQQVGTRYDEPYIYRAREFSLRDKFWLQWLGEDCI